MRLLLEPYADDRVAEEVAAYLRQQQEQAAEVRRDFEARSPQAGIRERLLARRRPDR